MGEPMAPHEELLVKYGPAGRPMDIQVLEVVMDGRVTSYGNWDRGLHPHFPGGFLVINGDVAKVKREPWFRGEGLYVQWTKEALPERFAPSVSWRSTWRVIAYLAMKRGYANGSYCFDAPCWKSAKDYLTQEGFPLGTTCWYVRASTPHLERVCCHPDDPQLLVCHAALWLAETLRDEKDQGLLKSYAIGEEIR